MGMGWARGIGRFVNEEAKNIHDNYDPMQRWLQGAWHSVHGQNIPDQPGLHSLAHGIENQPANYAAGILGALYGAGALAGSSAGGAAGGTAGGAGLGATGGGAASAAPIEEAGFAAGSTPSGAGWTAGTGGGTFGAGQGSGLMGTNYQQLLGKALSSQGQSMSQKGSPSQSSSMDFSQPDYQGQPAEAPSGAYSPLAPNPYKLPNVPQGMAYNDPNNPSFPTNSMNPYALNTQMQSPFNSGLYAMGATNA